MTDIPELELSDFDRKGMRVDVLALIRAGAGANGAIYATPPRGSVGERVAGELGLGRDETVITRIRRLRGGTMVLINDNAPLVLADYSGLPGKNSATL